MIKRNYKFQSDSVTGHFLPRSFRTQVISFRFGHFVPTLFSIWSFCTQSGHFVPISYPVWSLRIYFYYVPENRFGHFVPNFYCFVPKSFRTQFSHFVSRSFRTHFQTRYELTFFFAVLCYFQTRYELILVWNDFLFSVAMYGGNLYGSLGDRWKGRTTFW